MEYEKYYNADVVRESSKELFNVISCFAGGGGSSTGYRLAGGKILLINEFVQDAIDTYSANYPETPVLVDDIKKYSGEDFLKKANIKQGELDILDGSPPCSAFSVAGLREKGWNKEGKSYSTGKKQDNIEDLFLEFVRIAKDIKPKVIVAENVKGLTFGMSVDKLGEFLKAFEGVGYLVSFKVLNAADYSVPQARERVIIIGVREDVAEAIGMNVFTIHPIFPRRTFKKHIALEEALIGIENDPDEVKMLLEYVQRGFQKNVISHLEKRPLRPDSAGNMNKHKDWNPKGSYFNMIRSSPYHPCPTITQSGNQISACGVIHFEEDRKFTIKELKRIMGLPEDFILTGNFNKQSERIGRMVAPRMMEAVAKSIYKNVLVPYQQAIKEK